MFGKKLFQTFLIHSDKLLELDDFHDIGSKVLKSFMLMKVINAGKRIQVHDQRKTVPTMSIHSFLSPELL